MEQSGQSKMQNRVQVLTEHGKGTGGSGSNGGTLALCNFSLLIFLIIGLFLIGVKRKYECIF